MKKNNNIIVMAVILMLALMLTLAACGSEDDPPDDISQIEDSGINYNYNYIALGPFDAVAHDFYLNWEDEVY